MDDVLRRQHQPHGLADRHVQRIDLALAAGMLDLPHPLLADDIDFEVAGRRLVEPDIDAGAPDEEPRKAHKRRGGPADLQCPGLLAAGWRAMRCCRAR